MTTSEWDLTPPDYYLWGATCHTAEATLNVLRPVFDCIISRRADVAWPWGAIKDKCYAAKPETIDAFKDKMLKNWTDRVGYCIASRGSHLNEIIFHY